MNLTKPQLVIVAAVGLVVLIFILIFLGIIPGLQDQSTDPAKIKANLNFWGVGDNSDAYADVFSSFKTVYPNVTVTYRGFNNSDEYETTLLDALASGQGPDIFMIRNTNLPRDLNKITPVSPSRFSATQVGQLFPQAISRDFVYQNNVYALPLSVDTLALIYNRNIFDEAAVPLPSSWKDWDDFLNAIPKLTKRDSSGQITQAAAGIGGPSGNITNADDILYLLMLQNGIQLSSDQGGLVSFASDAGAGALSFYFQFSDPNSRAYTWNASMPNSLNAFASGKAGVILDYASSISKIKSQNAFVNVEVAPMPQSKGAAFSINYPDYWGYAVSRQSVNQDPAWGLILTMTTNDGVAKSYLERTQKPPALNSLIYQYQNDPTLGVFARQALTARSWLRVDGELIDQAISGMLESIAKGELKPNRSALEQVQNQINQILNRRSL